MSRSFFGSIKRNQNLDKSSTLDSVNQKKQKDKKITKCLDNEFNRLKSLNREVSQFMGEVKKENIMQKMDKFIRARYTNRKKAATVFMPIKRSNEFTDASIFNVPEYTQYEAMCESKSKRKEKTLINFGESNMTNFHKTVRQNSPKSYSFRKNANQKKLNKTTICTWKNNIF